MYQMTHCWKVPAFKEFGCIASGYIDRRIMVETSYHVEVFVGDYILFNDRLLCDVIGVRRYADFETMLKDEDSTKIDPDYDAAELLAMLRNIYDQEQEKAGVIVIQFRVHHD